MRCDITTYSLLGGGWEVWRHVGENSLKIHTWKACEWDGWRERLKTRIRHDVMHQLKAPLSHLKVKRQHYHFYHIFCPHTHFLRKWSIKHLQDPEPRLFFHLVTLDRMDKRSREDYGLRPQEISGQTDRELMEKQRGRDTAEGPNDLLLLSWVNCQLTDSEGGICSSFLKTSVWIIKSLHHPSSVTDFYPFH